jgi:hypothetical protein
VFHPGHHELHGVTVVVETGGTMTFVGRFDSEDEAGVHLLDVGMHDASQSGGGGGGASKDDYVRRSARFGIRVERKHLVVPRREVARIRRLGQIEGCGR